MIDRLSKDMLLVLLQVQVHLSLAPLAVTTATDGVPTETSMWGTACTSASPSVKKRAVRTMPLTTTQH